MTQFRIDDLVQMRTGKFAGQLGFVIWIRGAKVTVRLRRDGRWYHVAFNADSLELRRAAAPEPGEAERN